MTGSAPDYGTILKDIRDSERVNGPEFLIRLVLVISASLIAWRLLGLDILLYWVPTYYALIALEKLTLVQSKRWPPRSAFLAVLALGFLIAGTFAALPVHLWFKDGDIWKMGSLVLLVGGVLNVFLLRSRHWQVGLAYALPFAGAFFFIAADFFTPPYGDAVFWCAMFLAITMSVYMAVAVSEGHKSNLRLRAARDQFHEAQKREALGTLTGGIAHDFNNLLAIIRANLEMLQTEFDRDATNEFTTEALASVDRGAELTGQLLAYVRRSDLTPLSIDPIEVMRRVQTLTGRTFKANIEIRLRPRVEHRRIKIDPSMLEAALLNLCINARDAMPTGGTLTLSIDKARPEDTEAADLGSCPFLRLDVKDSGDGMSAAEVACAFDPFFTTKDVGKGTGLGLAMVKGFAQQSGGDAVISSSPGRGTTVTIFLPEEV